MSMNFNSLKGKLLIQLFSVAVFFAVLITSSILSMNKLENELEVFSSERLPISVEISNLDSNLNAVYRFSWLALARSADSKGRQESLAMMSKYNSKIEENIVQLEKLPLLENNKILLAEAKKNFAEIVQLAKKSASDLQENSSTKDIEAKEIMLASGKNFGVPSTKILIEMLDNAKLANTAAIAESEMRAQLIKSIMMVSSFILAGIYLIFSYLFMNKISGRLSDISENIYTSGVNVSSGSIQLSATSTELSSSSAETSASLTETVSSIEELTSTVKINSEYTTKARVVSNTNAEVARHGLLEAEKLKKSIFELSESSKKIEDIISVIDDIAFQTNLLALNAAVEAARAGEHGKGFAVVADAVRSLAQKSSSSAKELSSLIDDNVEKASHGLKSAEMTVEILNKIGHSVTEVLEYNQQIATSTSEQLLGIQQISQALNQVDEASQSNTAASEEVSATSEELSSQATVLREMVDQLNIIVNGKQKFEAIDKSSKSELKQKRSNIIHLNKSVSKKNKDLNMGEEPQSNDIKKVENF